MQLQQVRRGNRKGWRFGAKGVLYFGPNAQDKAQKELTKDITENYNPDQPRDERGRFGPGGGSVVGKQSDVNASSSKGDVSLARPPIILGDLPVHQDKFSDYLVKNGQEWKAAPLPKNILIGTPKECFKNATLLVLNHSELSYVEGVAFRKDLPGGMGFLHAWAVDKGGNVVDPTWKDAENCKYFGVKYDQKTYMKHIMKTKMYGVFGGDDRVARKVLENGGIGKRQPLTKMTKNVFCPTGPGGGVDATCSPGDGGSGGKQAAAADAGHVNYTGKDTMAKYKPANGGWTKERLETVHNPLLASIREGVEKANGPPVLYMTGGGYGSGKSTLLEKFPEVVGFPTHNKAIKADPDALKKGIPEYVERASGANPDKGAASYVHEESSEIAKNGVVGGLIDGYNVTYDTSGDTAPEKLEAKIHGFRKAGAQRVEAHYAFPGSVEEGQRRADSRAAKSEGGLRRFVPPAVLSANHAEVARCWLKSAERGVFDKLTLWSTAGKFGDPPSLIASVENGKTKIVDQQLFNEFKKIGGQS